MKPQGHGHERESGLVQGLGSAEIAAAGASSSREGRPRGPVVAAQRAAINDLSVASCSANLWVDRAMMLVLRLAWKTRHLGAQARTGTDRGEVQ